LTESKEKAEEIAKSKGYRVKWLPNDTMFIAYTTDAFEYFPEMDRNILYVSLADDILWFDNWPGVKDLPHNEKPLQMTYGDGTEFTQEERVEFIDVYDRYGFPIPWKQGDIAIFCNFRYAHGRPTIKMNEGDRRLLGVRLGPNFNRIGARPNKYKYNSKL